MRPHIPRLALTLALTLAALAPAAAQATLFRTVDRPTGQEHRPYLDRVRGYATFVEGQTALPELDAVYAETVTVPLPQGGTRTFHRTESRRGVSGYRLWSGTAPSAEGRRPASLHLARKGPYLLAFLDDGRQQYWLDAIQPGGGLHFWSRHDATAYPPDHSPEGEARLAEREREVRPDPHFDPVSGGDQFRAPDVPDECAIRLLVAYTSGIAASDLTVVGRIEISADFYNAANAASNVFWRVEIAAIERVFHNPATGVGFSTVLGQFEDPSDGIMDGIHGLRELYDADYCQLIVENDVDDGCGLASGIGSNYNTAFCVTQESCLVGNQTFAHEFAHLHGCKHDPYVLPLPAGKAHGYVYFPDRWRTVMAYNDQCEDLGDDCTRIQHWSNPSVNEGGVPTGTPNSTNPFAATHNNAEKLNETGLSIASYEALINNKQIYENNVVTAAEVANAEGRFTLEKPVGVDYTVNADGAASFRAAEQISIKPGFHAETGSSFSAYLDACVAFPSSREQQDAVLEAGRALKLMPNPATTHSRLLHEVPPGTGEGAWTLRLLDAFGRERGHWTGTAAAGPLTHDIPLADLPAGFYLVRLERAGIVTDAALQVVR